MDILHKMNRLLAVLVLLISVSQLAHAKQEIPDYQQSVDQMMKQEKADKKGTGFSEDDMHIMKQAGEKLDITMPDPGLKVGERAPDFTLPDAFGKPVNLAEQLQKGPVVLVFYRGAWCPFCNLHLHALSNSQTYFKKYNAQLIAITPQKPDKSLEQVKKDKYEFKVLSDLDDSVMRAYKLLYSLNAELVDVYKKHGLDVEAYNGEGRVTLPIPATYVIDRKGIIRAVHADTDYKKRMEPADIIDALSRL